VEPLPRHAVRPVFKSGMPSASLWQSVSPTLPLIEELARDGHRAVHDLCANLAATRRENQCFPAGSPFADELATWTQDQQGRSLPSRIQFELHGMSVAKPRFVEEGVKCSQLLSASSSGGPCLSGAVVHSVVADVPRHHRVAHGSSLPLCLAHHPVALSSVVGLVRQTFQSPARESIL
jgi:hypothetical protein